MSLSIEHRESHLDLIAGDWGKPNVHLTFTDPWGNHWQEMSGAKPELGPGGFECGVRSPGKGYTVQAGVNVWTFDHKGGGMTFLRWTEGPEPQPTPSPEPTPQPTPSPEPQPTPSPEPGPTPQDILVEPGVLYSARLQGDIIHWQEGMDPDAVYWFVGQHLPGVDLWLPLTEPLTPELLAAWHGELLLRVERYGRAVEAMQ